MEYLCPPGVAVATAVRVHYTRLLTGAIAMAGAMGPFHFEVEICLLLLLLSFEKAGCGYHELARAAVYVALLAFAAVLPFSSSSSHIITILTLLLSACSMEEYKGER